MVLDGRIREIDRLGNDAAEAADSGRRRVGNAVIDARRNLSGVCGRWYPVILDLHRFFTAISLIMMGGMVLLLMHWFGLLVHIPRGVAWFMRFGSGPSCLGHLVFGMGGWVNILSSAICAEQIAHWPYTPGLLVKWVSFLGCLHWLAGGLDLGVGGVSYFELLILYELWAGERLSLERAVPRHLRPGRPISVSAVPLVQALIFLRSCRFFGALMRSLCFLPGGLGRFCPALLVLITAGFFILVGRGVVMGSTLGLVRVLLSFS